MRASELFQSIDEPLTMEDLALQACDCPECRRDQVLMLQPACHPDGHIVAAYDRRSGRLFLGCQDCRTLYAALQIAHRDALAVVRQVVH
jgi:hypothetical protein